jgi:hypothetical protein
MVRAGFPVDVRPGAGLSVIAAVQSLRCAQGSWTALVKGAPLGQSSDVV